MALETVLARRIGIGHVGGPRPAPFDLGTGLSGRSFLMLSLSTKTCTGPASPTFFHLAARASPGRARPARAISKATVGQGMAPGALESTAARLYRDATEPGRAENRDGSFLPGRWSGAYVTPRRRSGAAPARTPRAAGRRRSGAGVDDRRRDPADAKLLQVAFAFPHLGRELVGREDRARSVRRRGPTSRPGEQHFAGSGLSARGGRRSSSACFRARCPAWPSARPSAAGGARRTCSGSRVARRNTIPSAAPRCAGPLLWVPAARASRPYLPREVADRVLAFRPHLRVELERLEMQLHRDVADAGQRLFEGGQADTRTRGRRRRKRIRSHERQSSPAGSTKSGDDRNPVIGALGQDLEGGAMLRAKGPHRLPGQLDPELAGRSLLLRQVFAPPGGLS